ncbi:thioredoxin [Stigmatella aurantiaca]|uniref:Thioredoxin n=1 Tax=Stigmatella aurantiaca TaxID=41 RepID=A0A1H7ULZ6_STIAU|nr:thioredoxin [Stigmatella aurantiaca]SEL97809.1 thioredoxin [Stigmatella aurantiaca]
MAGANVLNIGDGNFTKEVIESDKPVLVDFWASWCAPCRAIAPAIDALADQYKDQVKVAKMDVDSNQETPQKYGIRSIPTLLIFKGGKVVEQIVGTGGGKAKIEDAIKKAL